MKKVLNTLLRPHRPKNIWLQAQLKKKNDSYNRMNDGSIRRQNGFT